MELWVRYKQAKNLLWDDKFIVTSRNDWYQIIYDRNVISSILWPTDTIFKIGGEFFNRRHPHEKLYKNDTERNLSYLSACKRLSARLQTIIQNQKCIVYAPMRGAYPIWRTMSQFLDLTHIDVYYPVTSSFVLYPKEFGIVSKKGKNASGRYNNYQELERLKPLLSNYQYFVYIDEIISGGMMLGHIKEMIETKIQDHLNIIAVGLADRFGQRSTSCRNKINKNVENGSLHSFLWEGCEQLITEDQKFLLGIHYEDYKHGPHIIPVLDENLDFYPERKLFEQDVRICKR
ncbi:hypothetical protein [Candidatus Uabimicrobium amorphum]|uniref:Uncharacterized protein n=1 Tax=Uabimicrobium amorphum TaxID=2596890 RepID=A0A5S9ISQ9_UABAM|nr:hypothetical protein [Candidatus Uabimicrobium amorphum]BBM86860.1 hypothetical protein UABAM_05260 [Candidatus Uabimicrobium amorphum]